MDSSHFHEHVTQSHYFLFLILPSLASLLKLSFSPCPDLRHLIFCFLSYMFSRLVVLAISHIFYWVIVGIFGFPHERQDIFLFCLLLYHKHLEECLACSRHSVNICSMNKWDMLEIQRVVSMGAKKRCFVGTRLSNVKITLFL